MSTMEDVKKIGFVQNPGGHKGAADTMLEQGGLGDGAARLLGEDLAPVVDQQLTPRQSRVRGHQVGVEHREGAGLLAGRGPTLRPPAEPLADAYFLELGYGGVVLHLGTLFVEARR
mgnify:CR=1 FL=1